MSYSIGVAHDPSGPAGYLPGFAREEQGRRLRRFRFGTAVSPARSPGRLPLAVAVRVTGSKRRSSQRWTRSYRVVSTR